MKYSQLLSENRLTILLTLANIYYPICKAVAGLGAFKVSMETPLKITARCLSDCSGVRL